MQWLLWTAVPSWNCCFQSIREWLLRKILSWAHAASAPALLDTEQQPAERGAPVWNATTPEQGRLRAHYRTRFDLSSLSSHCLIRPYLYFQPCCSLWSQGSLAMQAGDVFGWAVDPSTLSEEQPGAFSNSWRSTEIRMVKNQRGSESLSVAEQRLGVILWLEEPVLPSVRDLAWQGGCWKAGKPWSWALHWQCSRAGANSSKSELSFTFLQAFLLFPRGSAHWPCGSESGPLSVLLWLWLVQGGLRCNNTLSLFITNTELHLEDPRVPTKARLSVSLLSLL